MKNFIQSGDTLDIVAPANVVSGQFVQVGFLGGIATTTALAGTTFALKTTGVFELPKLTSEVWGIGAMVYWDATNLWATIAPGTSNAVIGRASEPASNPSAVGRVLLSRFGV